MASDERRIQQAEGYLELGLHEQAIEALAGVSPAGCDAHPFPFHMYMATALQFRGRFAEAIPHFLEARKVKPAEVASYLGLGWCYKRVGRLDLAIEALHEACRICRIAKDATHLALAHYNLSCYQSLAGQKKAMLENLAAAIQLDPRYRGQVDDESDFAPFRDDPDFRRLLSSDD